MKIGKTMLIELKNRWKGFLIFILVIVLLTGGFMPAYPSFSEAYDEGLEGAENVDIDVIENEVNVTINLSWSDIGSAENYTLLIGRSPSMLVPLDKIDGIEKTSFDYSLPLEDGEVPERYFTVVAVRDGEEEISRELVGMQTNFESTSPMEDIWGMDYGDIKGFISLLWSTWWMLLIAVYAGYVSVDLISKDYEENRLDMLLSKAVSRRHYLLEKFSFISLFILSLMVMIGAVLVGSVYSLGELDTVSSYRLILSSLLAWPVFLVIIALSILAAVYLESSRKAVGASFVFILVQYGINMVGDLSESLGYLNKYTIMNYWDYEAALYGESISIFNIGFLVALAAILMVSALIIFEGKDIPV
ncbi:MAG: ABC transporter permease subunit [Candidatus Saliniplasma sp.]